VDAVNNKPSMESFRRFLATRRGAVTVAAAAAAVAGIALLVFINQYRDSVTDENRPTPVLIADRLIPKGTTADALIDARLFKPTTVPNKDVKLGAVVSAAAIQDQVTVRDIYPGEQLTATAFQPGEASLRAKLAGIQRAVAVNIDQTRGLTGVLRPGDRVDVLVALDARNGASGEGRTVLRPLMTDVLILRIQQGAVMVRLTDREAARLAHASDVGELRFLLRPPTGAKSSLKDEPVQIGSLTEADDSTGVR